MESIESSVLSLYHTRHHNDRCQNKKLYQQIAILRHYEDTNDDYICSINTSYIKSIVSKILFTSPDNCCLERSPDNHLKRDTTLASDNSIFTEIEKEEVVLTSEEKEHLQELPHNDQQNVLLNKFLGDDDELFEHMNERRRELNKHITAQDNFDIDDDASTSTISDLSE